MGFWRKTGRAEEVRGDQRERYREDTIERMVEKCFKKEQGFFRRDEIECLLMVNFLNLISFRRVVF